MERKLFWGGHASVWYYLWYLSESLKQSRVLSMFDKAINQDLLRMMVCHKNSLAQGISKFIKTNGVLSNLFKTNWVKSRRLKFIRECFFSCVCAAPFQLLRKHPGNSCWLQCVTWFMARKAGGRNHSLSERRTKCKWRMGEGRSLELWAPLPHSWLAASSPLLGDSGSAPQRWDPPGVSCTLSSCLLKTLLSSLLSQVHSRRHFIFMKWDLLS